ncbi:flagellar hook-length control protein FliK [Pseudidiomarina aestuarii]|uniref:flagellar hook-length control protein FliK n=1 Tax=Pseudidiomarina aestuarii TaxID=624146 RepID=UPI003A975C6F
MISMTNIQQLLQREPAAPTASSSAQSGFAETYAQAAESALQNATTTPREQSAASTSDRPVESTQQLHNRPKWMALFNDEAPAPSVAPAPLMTEQPIDPAQTDATSTLQAVAVAAPQLAPTNASKPVAGQPTMTEQPVVTSQTDKVTTDLKATVTNPAQAVAVASTKTNAEQPVMKEHAKAATATTQKLTAEQIATATEVATKAVSGTATSTTQNTQVVMQAAAQAKVNEGELKFTNHAPTKANPTAPVEQVVSSATAPVPQVAAVKVAPMPTQTSHAEPPPPLTPAAAQPMPQRSDLAIELPQAPELMRQNATAATPQEQMLTAQLAKELPVTESAKFTIADGANPNSMNATQSVAQSSSMSQQSFVADTASTAPQLTAKLGTQAWQQQLSQQVSQLVLQSDQSVALRLHPAELGSLMVQMKVDDGAAQLSIQSGNAQVRQALEQALPQLREALANQGIDLGQTHVGSQSARDFGQQSERHQAGQHENASDSLIAADNTDNDPTPVAPSKAPAGTLDLYA